MNESQLTVWAILALEIQNVITAIEFGHKDELRLALGRIRDRLFEMDKKELDDG